MLCDHEGWACALALVLVASERPHPQVLRAWMLLRFGWLAAHRTTCRSLATNFTSAINQFSTKQCRLAIGNSNGRMRHQGASSPRACRGVWSQNARISRAATRSTHGFSISGATCILRECGYRVNKLWLTSIGLTPPATTHCRVQKVPSCGSVALQRLTRNIVARPRGCVPAIFCCICHKR